MNDDGSERPVALVTGAARGIGAASAVALAGAGFDVAVNYRSSEDRARTTAEKCEELGARAMVVQADVSDEEAARRMVGEVVTQLGSLDALVNNAGRTVDTPQHDLDGLSMEDWDAVFAVNVRGLFQVTRAAVPHLRESPVASIVNMASIVGLRPGPQPFPYAASKAAVVNLTRTLAGALGPDIRVNAVAPGWLEGEWMEHALGDHYEDLMARRARRTPLRRCATPEDVADTVVSLITANRFVNGEVVVIDGDYSATT